MEKLDIHFWSDWILVGATWQYVDIFPVVITLGLVAMGTNAESSLWWFQFPLELYNHGDITMETNV